jgi:hypothetical protein
VNFQRSRQGFIAYTTDTLVAQSLIMVDSNAMYVVLMRHRTVSRLAAESLIMRSLTFDWLIAYCLSLQMVE